VKSRVVNHTSASLIYYLTPDWKLESKLPGNTVHPRRSLGSQFENMLEEWGINKKDLVCITTDNATNMTQAFEEFPDQWLGCFGHHLNLAISKTLKIQRVDTTVKACCHLVQGFSHSWKERKASCP
jgi:hypothetical protein